MNSTRGAKLVQALLNASLRPTVTQPEPGVVSLFNGQPDFDTPDHIKEALVDGIRAGLTRYGPMQGTPALREVIGASLATRYGAYVKAEEICITHGGAAAICAAIAAYVNPGDRVVIPTPTYSLYADAVVFLGGIPVAVPHAPGAQLDLDAIATVAPGAKLIILCNPCNPTGVVYPTTALAEVGRIAAAHGLLVLMDEAYDRLVYDAAAFTSAWQIPELAERLLYVQTFSKTYAMTGWRIGYVAAPGQLIDPVFTVHRTFNGPPNTAVQHAALAALTGPQECVEQMLVAYRARRDITVEALAGMARARLVPPEGAFYGFVAYDADLPTVEVAARAMAGGVMVRAGDEYGVGGEGHVRLSFATSDDELRLGLARLRDTLENL